MPILRRITAQECRTPGCKRLGGERFGEHARFCDECGQQLYPVMGWDARRLALAALALAGAAGLLLAAFAISSFLAHRPRPLTAGSRQHLEALVRRADGDRQLASQAQVDLDALIARERLDRQEALRFVADLRRRLQEARLGVARGLRLVAAGRFVDAIQEYRRAVENDPENATAWADLGLANAAAGREQEALEGYTRALQVDPRNWLAHYNLGLLWARRGEAGQALLHLQEAFAARPDPASPERRSMTSDLRAAAVPATIRSDPRFAALLADAEKTWR